MSETIIFQWGVCPTCLKPLAKTDPGTMEFKPCREHPNDEPMTRCVCRLCKRKSVDEDSPVLGGFAVCQGCLDSHVASVRMVSRRSLYMENGA